MQAATCDHMNGFVMHTAATQVIVQPLASGANRLDLICDKIFWRCAKLLFLGLIVAQAHHLSPNRMERQQNER